MLPSQSPPRSSRRILSSRVGSSFRRVPAASTASTTAVRASATNEVADPQSDTFWSPLRLDELPASGPESTLESLIGAGRDLWEDDESYERFLVELEETKRVARERAPVQTLVEVGLRQVPGLAERERDTEELQLERNALDELCRRISTLPVLDERGADEILGYDLSGSLS